MIKFLAHKDGGGMAYGFGFSEANLNRMEFNNEPIFFDFGYADRPDLFGLFVYCHQFETPESMQFDLNTVKAYALPFFNEQRGVTPESLRMFPIARSIMQKFRSTPYWGFDTHIEIAHPSDVQLIFSGPDEPSIQRYFSKAGFITPRTKRTQKGFGKWEDDRRG